MLNPVKPVDELTAARIVELLDPKTPWNRALWNLSLGLTLKEILEAIEANRHEILSKGAVTGLVKMAKRLAGADPSVSSKERKLLGSALEESAQEGFPRHDGVNFHVLSELAWRIDHSYLQGWAEALRRGLAGTRPAQRLLAGGRRSKPSWPNPAIGPRPRKTLPGWSPVLSREQS